MSNLVRYLFTVDSTSGATVKVERLGDAGELTEVPVGSVLGAQATVPTTAPQSASPQSVVINIFMGGPQPVVTPGPAPRAQKLGAMITGSAAGESGPPPEAAIIPGGGPGSHHGGGGHHGGGR